MLIEAGFDIAFECPAPTPMILQLSIHPSRDADLLTPDRIASDPPLPMRSYPRSRRRLACAKIRFACGAATPPLAVSQR